MVVYVLSNTCPISHVAYVHAATTAQPRHTWTQHNDLWDLSTILATFTRETSPGVDRILGRREMHDCRAYLESGKSGRFLSILYPHLHLAEELNSISRLGKERVSVSASCTTRLCPQSKSDKAVIKIQHIRPICPACGQLSPAIDNLIHLDENLNSKSASMSSPQQQSHRQINQHISRL